MAIEPPDLGPRVTLDGHNARSQNKFEALSSRAGETTCKRCSRSKQRLVGVDQGLVEGGSFLGMVWVGSR
eukprot:1998049-Rhodomonas_salina.1